MKNIHGSKAMMRINLIYSLVLVLLAILAMWLARSLTLYIALGSMIGLALISVWHHHNVKILSTDTVLEYFLTIGAATLVVVGAALH
jgi:O-antigen ligase